MNTHDMPAPEMNAEATNLPVIPSALAPKRPLADSPPLVNDGGVVKSGVYDFTDDKLTADTSNVVTCMKDNPRFPNPTPSLERLDSDNQDMKSLMAELARAKTLVCTVAARLKAKRKIVEANFRAEASYVQSASNGNTNAIISAGFLVRATPAPVGDLPAPVKLNLTLNGDIGFMQLGWEAVGKARSYNIQISEAGTMARDWKPFRTTSSTKQSISGLEPGKTYAFRIAAVGGASGQSPWSREAWRMAA